MESSLKSWDLKLLEDHVSINKKAKKAKKRYKKLY